MSKPVKFSLAERLGSPTSICVSIGGKMFIVPLQPAIVSVLAVNKQATFHETTYVYDIYIPEMEG